MNGMNSAYFALKLPHAIFQSNNKKKLHILYQFEFTSISLTSNIATALVVDFFSLG